MWLKRAHIASYLTRRLTARCRNFGTDNSDAPQIINPFTSSSPPQSRHSQPTSLFQELSSQIKFNGPLTVHDYMKIALTHPKFGFYMNKDVFGSKGHFTTSPEISQIFGELVGIWILYEWLKCGGKKPLRIVELGPGRGTLASDLSRVMAQFKQTVDCCSFHLVEISPYLKQVQEKKICKRMLEDKNKSQLAEQYLKDGQYQTKTYFGQPITWYHFLDQIPPDSGFTVFVANEFFDAFPIYKFAKVDAEWRELLIDINPADDKSLRWIKTKNSTPALKLLATDFANNQTLSDHLEVCPQTIVHIENIVDRINRDDGCLLICDYGYDETKAITGETINRDTFRAYRSHEAWEPLREPGTADLTADVDFGYIHRKLGHKAKIFGTITQEHFLKSLGVEVRLKKLLECTTNEEYQKDLKSGAKMLLEDMGQRFKFMAIFGKNSLNVPVAFEEAQN